MAGCTWAIVEGVNIMSVFQDIGVFFNEGHYIAMLDVIGWMML